MELEKEQSLPNLFDEQLQTAWQNGFEIEQLLKTLPSLDRNTHVPNLEPPQLLGQLLDRSAQRRGFVKHIPDTHEESLAQYSPVLFSSNMGLHATFESPAMPRYPNRQGPQVFAVDIQTCRFNCAHGVGTVQSTPFKDPSTEFTT